MCNILLHLIYHSPLEADLNIQIFLFNYCKKQVNLNLQISIINICWKEEECQFHLCLGSWLLSPIQGRAWRTATLRLQSWTISSAPRPPQAARCQGERPLHKHTHAQPHCNSIPLYTPPFSFTIWPLYAFCSPGASYVWTLPKAKHLRMLSWTHRLGCMKQTSHESVYNYRYR